MKLKIQRQMHKNRFQEGVPANRILPQKPLAT